MTERLRQFLVAHSVRVDGLTERELAMRVIHASGFDVRTSPDDGVPIMWRSDAYVLGFAEARLDLWRADEWDPDQPRDEHGMFTSAGGGTKEGAVKSGQAAIAKAVGGELTKIGVKIGESKVLGYKEKGELYSAIADKAEKEGNQDYADKYHEKAQQEFGAANVAENDAHAAEDEGGPDPTDEHGGHPEDNNPDNPNSDKKTVEMPDSELEGKDFDHAIEEQFGPGAKLSYDPEDSETLTVEHAGQLWTAQVGSDDDQVTFTKVGGKDYDSMSGHAILSSPEYKSLDAGQKAQIDKLMENDKPINEKMASFKTAAKSPEVNPPHNPNKTPEQATHAKAARDAAKEAVLTAKALRAELKKDPTNKQLEAHVKAAENAAKSARSAARKAEKAKDAKEAAKHAAKAQEHADKVSHLNKSTPDSSGPSVVKAKDVAKGSAKGNAAHTVDPKLTKALQSKADKLKEAANQPHPASWSAEKIAAKEAAQKVLVEHADPTTPEELKAAADALDKVAKQASAAGSVWGHGYSSLADEYREAAAPKETFEVGKATEGSHDEAPAHSARAIDSIKGEVVPEKVFKEHREKFSAELKGAEKKAVLAYSGSAYSGINSHLRAGKEPTEQMRSIDRAIAKAPAPRDMIVHRGVSGSFSKNLYSGLKPGDQIVEKAYSSTSAGGKAAFGGDVELHITVPKGYPIAPIPSHHPHEREYLLRRNTKFQVTKIEHVGDRVVAHVTVVHDKKED